ncbi:MAG TPA: AMP-binding protein, partial [Candidatus Hydrogenedentes bacterium]|nr:AMP-binding protein [Candidatus Hydrogenedentota bacterium]
MAADHTIGPIRFLWEAIPRWAALHPEREAVVDGKLRLSWRELDRHIRALAEVLRRAGVRPGDCVAQVSPPNAAFPIAFMAAARLGAFWAGFSPRYAPGELYAM